MRDHLRVTQEAANAQGFTVEVWASPEPRRGLKRLFGGLSAFFDAWLSAGTGVPPGGEVTGVAGSWRVVIISARNRVIADSGLLYDRTSVLAKQSEFVDLVTRYSPEELQRIVDARQ